MGNLATCICLPSVTKTPHDANALSAIIVNSDINTGPFLAEYKGYQPSNPRKVAQVMH